MTEREKFESAMKDIFNCDEYSLSETPMGLYYNSVGHKAYDREYASVQFLWMIWQACAASKQAELDAANAKIAELTATPQVPEGWISVKDRLPPDCSSYAISSMCIISNDGFVTFGYWNPEAETWDDGQYDITRQVTHWMPLPAAPKEK